MKHQLGKRILCMVLSAVLLLGVMPASAFAAKDNSFVLVAEGGGKLVIAPAYVAYEAGQTVREALAASGHSFTGLAEGVISEINGVVGNYTRSDEEGGYDLDKPASEIRFFRISEASDSKPSDGLQQLMPTAHVGHIGLYRNEETHEPVEYYCKLPDGAETGVLIVCDPMLATGGSAADAIDNLKARGCKDIRLMNLVAAPEGIKKMQERHPDVDIFVAAVDEKLNKQAYIVPGLGDAGDRIFGTK